MKIASIFKLLVPLFLIGSAEFVRCAESISPYQNEAPFASSTAQAMEGSQVLFDLDLLHDKTWRPIHTNVDDGVIQGELPTSLADGSAWTNPIINYSRATEEGVPYVNWNISRGPALLSHKLPSLKGGYYLRMTFRARSTQPSLFMICIGSSQRRSWFTQVSLQPTWETKTYDFILNSIPDDSSIQLRTESQNEIDIASFVLEAVSIDDAKSQFSKNSSDLSANLLKQSRFPLGMPALGMVSGAGIGMTNETFDTDLISISSDPSQPGESGEPSLKIAIPAQADGSSGGVVFPPFGIQAFWLPHTVSFSAKGSGSLTVRILENQHLIKTQKFELADSWSRYNLVCDLKPGVVYQVEMRPSSMVWFDAMQVVAGAETKYLSAQRPEVALSATPLSHVYLDTEPTEISYAVTGKTDGMRLRVKIVNIYNEQCVLPDIDLEKATGRRGKINFDAFPGKPFGPFRIEAKLVDDSGAPQSDIYETVVARVRSPRHLAEDAPQSAFGVHLYPSQEQLEQAKRLGFNWVRTHDGMEGFIGWHWLEPTPGEWHFHDEVIDRVRKAKMEIYASLETSPTWANGLNKLNDQVNFKEIFMPPVHLQDFGDFSSVVARRYDGIISSWEVWNEPWLSTDLLQAHPNDAPAYYAQLTASGFGAVKSVDPAMQMAGFNSSNYVNRGIVIGGTNWTKGVIAGGGLKSADFFTYHLYTSDRNLFDGDDVQRSVQTAYGPVADVEGNKLPIWMTEGSPCAGLIGPGFYEHSYPVPSLENYDETSSRMVRFCVSLLANNVQKMFLYAMYKRNNDLWRMLVGFDGTPHPSATAFSNLAYWLEDTHFVKTVPRGNQGNAYVFAGPDRTVVVFAALPDHQDQFTVAKLNGMQFWDLYGNSQGSGDALKYDVVYGVTTSKPDEILSSLKAD